MNQQPTAEQVIELLRDWSPISQWYTLDHMRQDIAGPYLQEEVRSQIRTKVALEHTRHYWPELKGTAMQWAWWSPDQRSNYLKVWEQFSDEDLVRQVLGLILKRDYPS